MRKDLLEVIAKTSRPRITTTTITPKPLFRSTRSCSSFWYPFRPRSCSIDAAAWWSIVHSISGHGPPLYFQLTTLSPGFLPRQSLHATTTPFPAEARQVILYQKIIQVQLLCAIIQACNAHIFCNRSDPPWLSPVSMSTLVPARICERHSILQVDLSARRQRASRGALTCEALWFSFELSRIHFPRA